MDRPSGRVLLENQDAWPLGIRGVVLNEDSVGKARDHIAGEEAIRGEFIVPMGGDPQFTSGGECLQACERRAHPLNVAPRTSGQEAVKVTLQRHRQDAHAQRSVSPKSRAPGSEPLNELRSLASSRLIGIAKRPLCQAEGATKSRQDTS